MGALPRVPLSRDTHGPTSNAAAVLAAVNSNSMLNPLLGSLVDPRACASALVNAAHGSYPDVLLQNNQVSSWGYKIEIASLLYEMLFKDFKIIFSIIV